MQRLNLFARTAFIANLFFAVCVVLQWRLFITNASAISTILILGYLLAPFVLNPAFFALYLFRVLLGKPIAPPVAKWLRAANLLFWTLQIAYFVFFVL